MRDINRLAIPTHHRSAVQINGIAADSQTYATLKPASTWPIGRASMGARVAGQRVARIVTARPPTRAVRPKQAILCGRQSWQALGWFQSRGS